MIYALLVFLIALAVLFFILFDRNILSPSVIGTSMFAVSTLFAVLNVDKWKFTISPWTVIMICLSLLFLGAGELLVHLAFYRRSQFREISYSGSEKSEIKVSRSAILAIMIVFSLLLLNYYREVYNLAVYAGYRKGNGLFLAYARIGVLNQNHTLERPISRLGSYSMTFAQAFAYIFSYIYLYNKIIVGKKHCARYVLPVLMYIPYIILSTGRTAFIYLICSQLIVGCCFYMQKKRWNPRYVGRIIGVGVAAIFLFLLLFILAGALKSSSIMSHAWDTISFYAGMSIPSLDHYFEYGAPAPNTWFGEHTLYGIYAVLHRISAKFPSLYAPYEFVNFNGTNGNVYTVIRRYHQDYGYFGLFFMMFSLGVLYSFMFLKYNNSRKNCGLLIYSFIFAPIVEMSIEERFFMNIISLGTLHRIIISWFVFSMFINHGFSRNFNFIFKYKCKNKKLTGGGYNRRVVFPHAQAFADCAVLSSQKAAA